MQGISDKAYKSQLKWDLINNKLIIIFIKIGITFSNDKYILSYSKYDD